jgi:transposase-like protein
MRTIELRADYTAETVRMAAAGVRGAGQARRLLAIAAVYDGMNRREAAKIGGMDRQTLRDWVHRFNAQGLDGPGQPQAAGSRAEADSGTKTGVGGAG